MNEAKARYWSKKLIIASILLFAFGLLRAQLTLGPYGLVHSLPLSFFAALALATLASAMLWTHPQEGSHLLLTVSLFVLITALWLTPLVIGGRGNAHPGYALTIADLGNSDYIVRTGHVDPRVSQRLNWPGLFILTASVAEVAGLKDFLNLVAIFPFVWQFVMLLPLHLLLRRNLQETRHSLGWAAVWVYYLSWASPGILHTQTLATFFMVLLTAQVLREKTAPRVGFWVSCLVLVGVITITHLLTALYVILLFALLNRPWRTRMGILVSLAMAFTLSWLIYSADQFVEASLPGLLGQILDLNLFVRADVVGRVSGSPEHMTIVLVRIGSFATFLLLGLAGYLYARRKPTQHDNLMVCMALASALLVVMIGAAYGYELANRAFVFLTLPIAHFSSRFLERQHAALVLVPILILMLPFRIIAQYGNQAMEYSSPGVISSWFFLHERTSGGGVLAGFPFGFMQRMEFYRSVPFFSDEFDAHPTLLEEVAGMRTGGLLDRRLGRFPHYYALTRQDRAFFDLFYGDENLTRRLRARYDDSNLYDLIYENPDVSLHISERE